MFKKLFKTIQKRKVTLPENSYTTSLFQQGGDSIVQKIGEEASEVIIASKNGIKKRIIEEVADLFYHIFVLLAFFNINLSEVVEELEKRSEK